jgi:hypothetical protein
MPKEMEAEGDSPLTDDDIKSLVRSKAGKHLVAELSRMLSMARVEVESVTPEGLPRLQGRIATLKEIILIFGDINE